MKAFDFERIYYNSDEIADNIICYPQNIWP